MKTQVWGGDAWGAAPRTTLQDWPAQLAAASRPPTPRGLCTSQDAAGLSALDRKKASLPGMASSLCGILSPSKLGKASWSGLVSREEAQLPIREKVGLNKC